MRDLSRSFNQKNNIGNRRIIRILAFGVVVFAVILIVKNFLEDSGGIGGPVTLKDAPFGLLPVNVPNTNISGAGVNLTSEKTTLKDVKYGGDATATATRSYGGGIYRLEINATMPDPKNVVYQVWLIGSAGAVPIDIMKGSKTSWSLSLADTDKFSNYRGILITLQRDKTTGIPEEHVMEGTF